MRQQQFNSVNSRVREAIKHANDLVYQRPFANNRAKKPERPPVIVARINPTDTTIDITVRFVNRTQNLEYDDSSARYYAAVLVKQDLRIEYTSAFTHGLLDDPIIELFWLPGVFAPKSAVTTSTTQLHANCLFWRERIITGGAAVLAGYDAYSESKRLEACYDTTTIEDQRHLPGMVQVAEIRISNFDGTTITATNGGFRHPAKYVRNGLGVVATESMINDSWFSLGYGVAYSPIWVSYGLWADVYHDFPTILSRTPIVFYCSRSAGVNYVVWKTETPTGSTYSIVIPDSSDTGVYMSARTMALTLADPGTEGVKLAHVVTDSDGYLRRWSIYDRPNFEKQRASDPRRYVTGIDFIAQTYTYDDVYELGLIKAVDSGP